MPITQSAKKALRQNARRAKRNILRKEAYKKLVKSYRNLVAQKNTAEAAKQLPAVYQALDKAAKNKVIEWNKAGRLKSRLSQLLSVKK
ncbi:MAG: 30S ribosomal protein S20 [Candidatus Ryanbacteria bacterium RIFCSPLOWO2_01_FULL_48_26]|uniref:Small ribosomal subunit protein bS20 n=1 Tax=Candidatus Ryanbacteria bacterium RIFCSPLOWO2_01_FULL_48_26 TaxID=1802126 RepID=A0A1G2GS58_9BACT|nr:MAG: 30S ribosomal protein S20 [Candidatus Ryanbacteria bacterium RIFCSPLOWO2_01_FULL_48_26]